MTIPFQFEQSPMYPFKCRWGLHIGTTLTVYNTPERLNECFPVGLDDTDVLRMANDLAPTGSMLLALFKHCVAFSGKVK